MASVLRGIAEVGGTFFFLTALFNMPIGNPHAFKNEADQTARMLISYAPAGLEDYFFVKNRAETLNEGALDLTDVNRRI